MSSKKKYYDLDKDNFIKDDFYDFLANQPNPLSSFVHKKRYQIVNQLVLKYYRKGGKIADFACGNCSWNSDKLPVTGIDISLRFLKYAQKHKRIKKALREDITKKTSLAPNSIDILIISETLEHLPEHKEVLKEIKRVLKPGGKLIVTVPYDTLFSFWRPLFAGLCFFQGQILGKGLYKNKCGHIQSFGPKSLKPLLEENGFQAVNQFDFYRFILFTVAQKPSKKRK